MLLLVRLGQFYSNLSKMFLHCRIQCQFLTDGMTCDGPCELVPPSHFGGIVLLGLDVLVEYIESIVVSTNRFGNSLRHLVCFVLMLLDID